jgi:putative addiction module component (TIGR02574 family)
LADTEPRKIGRYIVDPRRLCDHIHELRGFNLAYCGSEQEKAIIEARLEEYDRNPETGSSWEEAKARILAGLRAKLVTA